MVKMSERRVISEKLSLLTIAHLLIVEGLYHVHISEIWQGIGLIGFGILLLYLRERRKFGRWTNG